MRRAQRSPAGRTWDWRFVVAGLVYLVVTVALPEAVRLLGRAKLENDYAAAWDEWHVSGEREAWDGLSSDGLA